MTTPKTTITNLTPTRNIGEYPLAEAFGVVRELEHAGIHADITAAGGCYAVAVAESDYERALLRV